MPQRVNGSARLARVPLVIDTDIGGDPDDTLALAVAAQHVPELALVITSDEHGGERARFARHLLDLLGRTDVPVQAGRQLDDTPLFFADGLVPGTVEVQPADAIGAVVRLCGEVAGPVRWLGIGPLSNLADLLTAHPRLADRLHVVQKAGALNYRRADRADHNVHRDVAAAKVALGVLDRPRLVISDTTSTDLIGISPAGGIPRRLAAAGAPGWARLVAAHLDRWYAAAHPTTRQHDPLTLTAALGLPYVGFAADAVQFDSVGRMARHPAGIRVLLSQTADHPAFMRWLADRLDTGARVERAPAPSET